MRRSHLCGAHTALSREFDLIFMADPPLHGRAAAAASSSSQQQQQHAAAQQQLQRPAPQLPANGRPRPSHGAKLVELMSSPHIAHPHSAPACCQTCCDHAIARAAAPLLA
jgi:hypothetical protein